MPFPIDAIRAQFPALHESFNGQPAIFFDNPGGTQVPQAVIDATVDYYTRRNANVHGPFETSRRTDATIDHARRAAADLLHADPTEIVFGNNMTSLAFALSHTLAHEISAGDEIVVTRLDHDANVAPWLRLAEETGASVRWIDIDPESCTLDMAHAQSQISERTKLLAVGYASNAVGTINDVATIVGWAREAGALSFIDAVQYAPHGLIDVEALGCDFLACSAYKFFGPHVGILYGKRQHLERLNAYRVRPAGNQSPDKWETGTKNHEGLAGTAAAIDYLASLGAQHGGASPAASRRERLAAAWQLIHEYERLLMDRLLDGLLTMPGVRLYGLTESGDREQRVITVGLRKEGTPPDALARRLGEQNIFAWSGNFYAVAVTERLGIEEEGGLLRVGLAHYNTVEEVDRCLAVIEE